jgi:hypothetical protein
MILEVTGKFFNKYGKITCSRVVIAFKGYTVGYIFIVVCVISYKLNQFGRI